MFKRKGKKIVSDLKEYNEELDQINQKLQQFLEKKRNEFARFYFLSDDELLEIISSAGDIEKV